MTGDGDLGLGPLAPDLAPDLLSEIVETGRRREDLAVLVHGEVPPNDGGISVGQAAIAARAEAAEAAEADAPGC